MRTSPELYRLRGAAERALWHLADDGRADCRHDSRYAALVLRATFCEPAMGQGDCAIARLIRVAFIERSPRRPAPKTMTALRTPSPQQVNGTLMARRRRSGSARRGIRPARDPLVAGHGRLRPDCVSDSQ